MASLGVDASSETVFYLFWPSPIFQYPKFTLVDWRRYCQHKDIEIVICETAEAEHDETCYLFGNPANKARLLAALDNVSQGRYVAVELDAWS